MFANFLQLETFLMQYSLGILLFVGRYAKKVEVKYSLHSSLFLLFDLYSEHEGLCIFAPHCFLMRYRIQNRFK